MRLACLAIVLATPLHAWEFTPVPVCTLSHAASGASVTVTHDPRLPEPYAIALTRVTPWPAAPVFAIRFDGTRGLTISTRRHLLSDGATTLTVTDTGFGNVLDGIEFNTTATALVGSDTVEFPLAGAAPAVQAFRACTDAGLA